MVRVLPSIGRNPLDIIYDWHDSNMMQFYSTDYYLLRFFLIKTIFDSFWWENRLKNNQYFETDKQKVEEIIIFVLPFLTLWCLHWRPEGGCPWSWRQRGLSWSLPADRGRPSATSSPRTCRQSATETCSRTRLCGTRRRICAWKWRGSKT